MGSPAFEYAAASGARAVAGADGGGASEQATSAAASTPYAATLFMAKLRWWVGTDCVRGVLHRVAEPCVFAKTLGTVNEKGKLTQSLDALRPCACAMKSPVEP